MTANDLLSFYLSTEGRITRRALALKVLLPFFVFLLVIDLANSPGLSVLVWALLAWPLFVATPWKRLHDMGRTGRWNIPFLVFYGIGFAFFLSEYVAAEGGWARLFDGLPPQTTDDALTAGGLGGFSTVLIFLPVHLFWLYLIPSQRKANPYGPAPQP